MKCAPFAMKKNVVCVVGQLIRAGVGANPSSCATEKLRSPAKGVSIIENCSCFLYELCICNVDWKVIWVLAGYSYEQAVLGLSIK